MKKKNIVLDFFLKHKLAYIAGMVFVVLASYIQALFPKVLGNTIDILSISSFNKNSVKTNILFMVFIAAGTFLSTFIWRNLIIRKARGLECHIRELLFEHFQKMSPEFYNRRKTGDLIAYAINDINAVRMTFGPATARTAYGAAVCIASIYEMIQAMNWKYTVMCLAPIPVVIVVIIKVGEVVQKRFRRVQENFASISDRIQENIYGIRVIKAYAQEDKEVENFEKLNNQMMESNMDLVKASSILSPVIELCFGISFILNLIVGGKMVLKGSVTLGDFVAFNTYLAMIMAPIISIGRITNIYQRGIASYKRLNDIFNTAPDITDGEAMVNTSIKGNIDIKNLDFSYPGSEEKALKNINVSILKGHTLGIIGRTGSGKTTLANLLLKLYNIQSGQIYIDNIDINDYTLNALRSGFGYVPQDNFLFSVTIKENIKFFKDDYSMEQVENASKISCIHDSIVGLPQGYDTILGERGVNLSGGQKQRISIARAIIKNPAVLILDDALSAVDTINESKILKNLKNIRRDLTTIIIAHKVSSVMDADEIIVLDSGEILERGTHNELVEKGGLYCEIYNEQSKEKEASGT